MILHIITNLMKSRKRTTFTQLRNNAKKYFDAVERGDSVEVFRHGKLVALLSPIDEIDNSRWQTASPRRLVSASLSKAILDDREGTN
jgi:prevent-host-death family protein